MVKVPYPIIKSGRLKCFRQDINFQNEIWVFLYGPEISFTNWSKNGIQGVMLWIPKKIS